jgi:hypothetical protein
MEQAIIELTQFIVMFIATLAFSIIALNRQSIVSNGLASLMWVVFAIMNFIIGSSIIGVALSWVLGLLGFMFAGVFITHIISGWADAKHTRFDF